MRNVLSALTLTQTGLSYGTDVGLTALLPRAHYLPTCQEVLTLVPVHQPPQFHKAYSP